MRNKTKSQNTFPPPLPSSWAQLHYRFSLPPPPQRCRGTGNASVHHTLSLPLLPPQGQDSSLFPCSRVGSLPQETVLHELLQRGSFPRAAVLHELLQHGSFPQGAVLQEQIAPVWVSCGVTSPARKPASAWASLFPWVHRSFQEPAPAWASHGVTASFGRIHLLWHGVLHGLQGDSLPHHGLHHGLQGNLCSGAWSTSFPSFFTDLGVCRVVSLTCSRSALQLPFPCALQLFPLLKYVIPEALPLSLIGSALAGGGSVLELAGIGSIGHRGSFQQLLTEATPVTPPLPKPCHTNPIQVGFAMHYCNRRWFLNTLQ
ncbi:uncharacterized protein ACIBXB_006070 [Morphnus guianensis]